MKTPLIIRTPSSRWRLPAFFLLYLIVAPGVWGENKRDHTADIDKVIEQPDKPLYSPFTARYLLDEIKLLRIDLERTRAELLERQIKREYEIAKDAAGYARNAVELFFFIITVITTLLVFFGWRSLSDIRSRVKEVAEAKVDSIVGGYAGRLDTIEAELLQKSKSLSDAQVEIEETNEIHSMWLRASQETTPAGKIAIYDEILKLRPQDTEAITFKADAALLLDEPQWALSLANRALDIDPTNGHAYYQRACAYVCIGDLEQALADLGSAVDISDSYKDMARSDPAFDGIKDNQAFQELILREETDHGVS